MPEVEDYVDFFLASKASVVQFECLELSHSAFSQTYYLVRNAAAGITATDETGASHVHQYCPMAMSLSGPREDLDHILSVTLVDVGEIIAKELQLIEAADAFSEFPVVKYRTYRSDLLTKPLYGPLLLQVRDFSLEKRGAVFEAKAPSLNVSRTGERYNISRFPALAGLL